MAYCPIILDSPEQVKLVQEFLRKPEKSELCQKIEKLELTYELCGDILRCLLLERNREHIHPELIKLAERWNEAYERNRL